MYHVTLYRIIGHKLNSISMLWNILRVLPKIINLSHKKSVYARCLMIHLILMARSRVLFFSVSCALMRSHTTTGPIHHLQRKISSFVYTQEIREYWNLWGNRTCINISTQKTFISNTRGKSVSLCPAPPTHCRTGGTSREGFFSPTSFSSSRGNRRWRQHL